MFNKQSYDVTKFFAQILLPAIGTLYFSLAGIWGLPNAQEVVGTIVAVDAFLGLLLSLDTKAYNSGDNKYDGKIDVTEGDEGKLFSLELNTSPEDLEKKKEVIFKVDPSS